MEYFPAGHSQMPTLMTLITIKAVSSSKNTNFKNALKNLPNANPGRVSNAY